MPVAVGMARLLADIHETVDPAKVSVPGAEGPWLESGNRRRLVDGQGSLRVGSALCLSQEKVPPLARVKPAVNLEELLVKGGCVPKRLYDMVWLASDETMEWGRYA